MKEHEEWEVKSKELNAKVLATYKGNTPSEDHLSHLKNFQSVIIKVKELKYQIEKKEAKLKAVEALKKQNESSANRNKISKKQKENELKTVKEYLDKVKEQERKGLMTLNIQEYF